MPLTRCFGRPREAAGRYRLTDQCSRPGFERVLLRGSHDAEQYLRALHGSHAPGGATLDRVARSNEGQRPDWDGIAREDTPSNV